MIFGPLEAIWIIFLKCGKWTPNDPPTHPGVENSTLSFFYFFELFPKKITTYKVSWFLKQYFYYLILQWIPCWWSSGQICWLHVPRPCSRWSDLCHPPDARCVWWWASHWDCHPRDPWHPCGPDWSWNLWSQGYHQEPRWFWNDLYLHQHRTRLN